MGVERNLDIDDMTALMTKNRFRCTTVVAIVECWQRCYSMFNTPDDILIHNMCMCY
eukprot:m.163530 g.163530  ORF g.163530 m.163530 type:complete len:56 (-) comp18103_c0_seq11:21-188(-)